MKVFASRPPAAVPDHGNDVRSPLVPPVGLLDVCGIGALCLLLLLLSYLQSRNRMMWGDEIMGVYTLDSHSWAGFLQRWRAGIDSSGFWFYVFAKPWEWIFGHATGLRLRLFSATGIATSAGLIWLTARRFYSLPVVAVSVTLIYLDVGVLRWQLANGRCYGVFMAAAALVLYLIFRGENEPYRHPRLPFLLATALAYDLLTGSHILGILYAAAFLALQIILDLRARRLRIPLYVAAIVGIVPILLFSLRNIESTTALGKPAFWTSRPEFGDLFLSTDLTDSPVRFLLVVLLALTLVQLRRRPARSFVYWVFLGFVGLDLVFFAISIRTTSIYVDRYLLPFAFALVLLCAELLTQLREMPAPHARLRSLSPLFLLILGVINMPPYDHPYALPLPNYTQDLVNELPAGLPVVDTDIGSFVEVEYYQHGKFGHPFLFPIDPGVTADPRNRGGVSGFHEMDNFLRLGLDEPDLQPTEAILSQYPRLLVITAQTPTAWFAKRILETSQYNVHEIGLIAGNPPLHLWEVERR